METAEEGKLIAVGNRQTSYGGTGAGGKFRRKAFRRQATPYDRPPGAPRGNDQKSAGWLTKIFVDPAVKLISYGADRLFASVFRKRLPAPAPPQQPEESHYINDGVRQDVLKDERVPEEPVADERSHPVKDSSSSGISELEQLLKQCTFTRFQIVCLTELLQSKVREDELGHGSKERENTAPDLGEHQQFTPPVTENGSEDIQLPPSVLTPVHQSNVPKDDFASPAEIAKAYMGRTASRVSPSVLGIHRHFSREESSFPTKTPLDFKSSTMPLSEKNSVSTPTFENGFAIRRSRRTSAISNIADTPYTRGHSLLKVPSPSLLHSVGSDKNYDLGSRNLKRRSADVDDDGIAIVGSIRRTRQKPNLLATQIRRGPFVEGVGSNRKQKYESMHMQNSNAPINALENAKPDAPSTSYAVPSRSSEVAAKILQQLENLSPKEKSSKSTGQALRTSEGVGSPKLPLDLKDKSSVNLPMHSLPTSDGALQNSENKKENNLKDTLPPFGTAMFDMNNELSPMSKSSMLRAKATSLSSGNGESEPSKKITSKKSAQEESSRSFQEKPVIRDSSSIVNKELREGNNFMKTHELGSSIVSGTGGTIFTFPSSEKPLAAPLPEAASSSFGLVKESKLPNQLFSFGSKLDTSQGSKLENPSSLTNIFPATGLQVKNPEVEVNGHLSPAKAYTNGKPDTTPLPANEEVVSASPASLPSVTASSNITQKSALSGFRFSSSTSAADSVKSSTSSPFGNSIFGLNAASTSEINLTESSLRLPSQSTGADSVNSGTLPPFQSSLFHAAEKSSKSSGSLPVTASSTPITSEASGFSTKAVVNHSSHDPIGSQSLFPAAGAASTGLATSILGDATTFKAPFAGDSFKNSVFGTGTFLHGSSVNAGSSLPSVNTHSSSLPSSQVFSGSTIFGSSTSTSPFGLGAPAPNSAQSSSVTKADASDANANGTPFKFSSGFSGSATSSDPSSSTLAVGAGSSGAAPIFKFNSSTSFLAGSSGSAPASGISSVFGWSSAASSSGVNNASSNSASSNVFGSSLQSQISPSFGSTIPPLAASSTPSFTFTSTASVFTSTASPSSFATSPSLPITPPIFGKPLTGGFTSSPGSGDQMHVEDSMAEDPVQSSAPVFPVFGQPSASQSASVPTFGSTPPSQANPFASFDQLNQVGFQQSSGNLELNASGGSFSLGSGGPDKSRRIVRVSKIRNRKKA